MGYKVISEHLQDLVIIPVFKVIAKTPSIEAAYGAVKRTRAEFEERGYSTSAAGGDAFTVSIDGGDPLMAIYITREG